MNFVAVVKVRYYYTSLFLYLGNFANVTVSEIYWHVHERACGIGSRWPASGFPGIRDTRYDVAKLFSVKFSHISPVWLRLPPSESCIVEGLHDIDTSWMSAVKSSNEDVKFVPRLLFDGWTESDYQKLLRSSGAQSTCISTILPVLKNYKFDGIVLEIWMQHSGTSHEELMLFIRRLSKRLHENNMAIVLAIPPPVYQGGYTGSFAREHFDFLSSDVDFFSLMTYDYSNPYMPGPNSPIKWVRECVELLVPSGSNSDLRSKILVGLNFYGYDLVPNQRSGHPILGHEFVKMVDKHHPKFRWNSEWAEHYIEFEDSSGHEHVVYFPTTLSIARRISLIQELGTGLAIWEIGQGLDSFYGQL
ncbi:hypothetical protein AAHC03_0606 [Spirometra sp. Aus1]